jgi:hypothetical protein
MLNVYDEVKFLVLVWWGSIKRKIVKPKITWKTVLNWILKTQDEKEWTGFVWVRKGTNGGLLRRGLFILSI